VAKKREKKKGRDSRNRKESRTSQQPSLSEGYRIERHRIWAQVAKIFLGCTTAVLVSLFAIYLPIKESAGQETVINYVANLVADFDLYMWASLGAAGVAGTGWYRERKKGVEERAQRDQRIAELERQIDPNRTSSNMTPEGNVVPESKEK